MIIKQTVTLFLAAALLVLTACTGTSAPQADLNGTSWTLTGINGQPVLEGTSPSLSFADGQASGSGSCNGFGGEYTQSTDELTFGALMSTLMACEPAALMDQEQAYFAALGTVTNFAVSDGKLDLLDQDGNVVLTFAAQDTTLEGKTWQVTAYFDGASGIVSTVDGSIITAQFADGSISGSSGCNQYNAAYTQDGQALNFADPASTKMYCEGLMDQEIQYLLNLASVASYRMDAGHLTLLDAGGNTLVEFTTVP